MVYFNAAKVGISNGAIGMPLSRRQLELGIDSKAEDWMRQAYQMLVEHRDLAYSTEELQVTILGVDVRYREQNKFAAVLDVLAETGAADKGEVDGTDYYPTFPI